MMSVTHIVLIAALALLAGFGLFTPQLLSDKNAFIAALMSADGVNIQGIFLSVGAATCIQHHIGVGAIERLALAKGKLVNLAPIRAALKRSILSLLISFVLSIFLSLFAGSLHSSHAKSCLAAVAIFLLVFSACVVADLVVAVLKTPT